MHDFPFYHQLYMPVIFYKSYIFNSCFSIFLQNHVIINAGGLDVSESIKQFFIKSQRENFELGMASTVLKEVRYFM